MMNTLRELKMAIDTGAMVVAKGETERETTLVYFEDGYYTYIRGGDLYDDFEEMLTDMGEAAAENKWRIATPLLDMPFPEDWPERYVQSYKGHVETWKAQSIAGEWQ